MMNIKQQYTKCDFCRYKSGRTCMAKPDSHYCKDALNEFYPEIYKMLYPMVCKICNQNKHREITKDLIDRMTDEIYVNFDKFLQKRFLTCIHYIY